MPRASKPLISTTRVDGPAVGADGGQRHRVRLGQLRVERLLEPQPNCCSGSDCDAVSSSSARS
jgi:hypothetical protein